MPNLVITVENCFVNLFFFFGAEKHWSGVQLLQFEAQIAEQGESEEGENL